MHDSQHSPKIRILLKAISFFRSENVAIFTVKNIPIHNIKKQNNLKQGGRKLKIQGSNWSKDGKIEFISKKVRKKRKEKVLSTRN